MSLRDEAITHMAVVRAKRMNRKEWDDLTVRLQDVFKEDVSLCLDALLDFLDAHTEEWRVAVAYRMGDPNRFEEWANLPSAGPFIPHLVAALRGTTEEQ